MTTKKEEIYDNEIHSLMTQIIGICKENKIAMLCQFDLGFDEEAGSELHCTTALLDESHEPSKQTLAAYDEVKPKSPSFFAFTITTDK